MKQLLSLSLSLRVHVETVKKKENKSATAETFLPRRKTIRQLPASKWYTPRLTRRIEPSNILYSRARFPVVMVKACVYIGGLRDSAHIPVVPEFIVEKKDTPRYDSKPQYILVYTYIISPVLKI